MKLKIEITMDSAVFDAKNESFRVKNADEPARILRQLTVGWNGTTLEAGNEFELLDINGNTVGKARVTR